MAGGSKAFSSGRELQLKAAKVAEKLNLEVQLEVSFGHTIFGRRRRIDLLIQDQAHHRLAVECKYQGVSGTAEEKIVATMEDFKSLPIEGLIVFDGQGFSQGMRGYLMSTGRAIPLEDLEDWLRMFFHL